MNAFPLKEAYDFAKGKGLSNEVEAVRKGAPGLKPPHRRGMMIELFKKHGLLEEFIKNRWPDGNTPGGTTRMKWYIRKLEEYRQPQKKEIKPIVETIETPPEGSTDHPESLKKEEEPVPGIKQKLLARILALTPKQFENLVGEFLNAKGFSDAKVLGRSGDGGLDGECSFPFIKVKVAFQAKRYGAGSDIRIDQIRNFRGGLNARAIDRGLFITTSSFSPGAKEEAELPGIPIALIDGAELVSQMTEMNLGVKTVPVVRQELDEEFFGSLEG